LRENGSGVTEGQAENLFWYNNFSYSIFIGFRYHKLHKKYDWLSLIRQLESTQHIAHTQIKTDAGCEDKPVRILKAWMIFAMADIRCLSMTFVIFYL